MTWVEFTNAELAEMLGPRPILALSAAGIRRAVHDKLKAALEDGQAGHKLLAGSFKDDRGRIQDLIMGPVDAVTLISTVEGGVRGNHLHKLTTQWTYLLSGSLLVSHNGFERVVKAGEIFVDEAGASHAWRALEDTDCLVFTQGPRSGTSYESDTVRLDRPLL